VRDIAAGRTAGQGAADGVDAIALMQEQAPSLVLTDLRMPRMDGMELARYIKSHERFSQIPVVLISAHLPAASARSNDCRFPAQTLFGRPPPRNGHGALAPTRAKPRPVEFSGVRHLRVFMILCADIFCITL
jgi:hypothetical protein